MITCYLRFGDLDSWLTLEPLSALIRETGTGVEWKTMLGSLGNVVSTNLKSGDEDPLAAYKARRAKARADASAREFERVCTMLAVDPDSARREINPLMLSAGLAWLSDRQAGTDNILEYCRAAFDATFRDQAPVEAASEVAIILETIGAESAGFEPWADAQAASIETANASLLEQGILTAPAFVVDGEVFLGREHLPLLTWMLTGKRGRPPV